MALDEWELLFQPGDVVYNVHIPEGAPLDATACEESYHQASALLPIWFPELDVKVFACQSWLLDPQLTAILPETTNIVRFQSPYCRYPTSGGDRQMRERVFGDPVADPLAQVPVSSLQKAIVAAMVRHEQFNMTGGFRKTGPCRCPATPG